MSGAESRLSRMIARLITQRACLEHAAGLIADLPGPVLELGLGKGRTYDHLRRTLPDREIFAFDLGIYTLPDAVPDDEHLILGDFMQTLDEAAARLGGPAALAHADIGSEDRAADAARAAALAPVLDRHMAAGGIVLGDREMAVPRWSPLPLPPGVEDWPYFIYKVAGD